MDLTFDEKKIMDLSFLQKMDKFPNCLGEEDIKGTRGNKKWRNPRCGGLAVHYFIPKLLGLPYKDEEKKYENLYIQQNGVQRWTKSTLKNSPTSRRKRTIQEMEDKVKDWYVTGHEDWWKENLTLIQKIDPNELDQLMIVSILF